MANYLVGITLKATDQASVVIAGVNKPLAGLQVGLDAANKGATDFQSKWGAVSETAIKVGAGLAGVGAAGLALGAHFTQLAGQMANAQKSFTNLLHSSGLAKKFIADLQEFGASTPFEFIGLQSMSKQLLAFGFASQEIIPMLRSVGDAMSALGGGEEGVQRVVEGLGRIQAKGTMTARELMQLASTGIPVFQILQDELGLTAEEVGKIGLVGLSSGKAIDALLKGMDKRFGGAMEAQSKTLTGALSNLQDTLDITSAGLGAGLVAPATMGVRALTSIIDVIRQLPPSIQAAIGTGMTGMAGLALVTGLGIVGFVKLVKVIAAARAAMLAFGETEVGMMVASRAMIALNWLQTLSVESIVASLRAKNAAIAQSMAGTAGLTIATALGTAANWAYATASAALAATMGVVAGAARIMWAAIMGPIGLIVAGITLVGGLIWALVAHNNAVKKSVEDRTAAEVEGAAAATEADKKAQAAKLEAADAAEKAEQATIDLADAEKSYQRAVEDQPRIARDTAAEIRDAKESQAEAAQGVIDQERQAAESIADAQKKISDAHKDSAKVAEDSARSVADAQRRVSDATEQARERVESASDAVAKAYRSEQKAAEALTDAKVKGEERVKAAEDRAADRQASAQKRLDDLLKKQAGIEETPEERMAREIQEARDEVNKATTEGQKAVDDAKKQAQADDLAAQEALTNAQAETQKARDDLIKAEVEGKRAIADAEVALKDARVAAADAEQKAAERVTEAEKALSKAREDNDKAKADAERRLRDATEAYVRAAEQAPRKLQDAADAMAKAARALEKAKGASATANEEATAKAAAANPDAAAARKGMENALKRDRLQQAAGFVSGATSKSPLSASPGQQAITTGGRFLNWWAGKAKSAKWNANYRKLVSAVGEKEANRITQEILDAPGRSAGGPVTYNKRYIVGERGPELFIPRTSGTIIPNSAPPSALAGAGVVNNITNNFNGPAYGDAALRNMIEETVQRMFTGAKYATT